MTQLETSVAVTLDDDGLVLLRCPGDRRHQFKVAPTEGMLEVAIRARIQPSLLTASGKEYLVPVLRLPN